MLPAISNSTTDFFVVKRAFPPAQDLRQLRCQARAALLPQLLRHAVECLGDAAGDGGEGVAVTAEGYRRAQRVFKIAPYIRLPPSFLHILVDAALPIGAERPGGADAAHRLADDLVVQRRASHVALVVHRAVRANAEARRLLCRVDVCAEEQKFPAVSLLLPFNHAAHSLVIVAAAGVFVAVGGDDEHRLLRHILPAGVLVNVADVVDGAAHGIQQGRAATGEIILLRHGRYFLQRQAVMDNRAVVGEKHRGDQRLACLLLLLCKHGVEAADGVRFQPRHRTAAIQNKNPLQNWWQRLKKRIPGLKWK